MRTLSVFFKFVFLFLIICSPLGATGFFLAGRVGLGIGVGIGYLFFSWLCMRCEEGILRIYGAQAIDKDAANSGVRRSYLKAAAELGDSWSWEPKLFLFSDPSPSVLVIRRPGSEGAILLSRGLFPGLSEEELRSLLKTCLLRTRERGIILSTLSAFCSARAFRTMPRAWVLAVFSDGRSVDFSKISFRPVSAALFMMGFVVLRFFTWLGSSPAVERIGALQKLTKSTQVWGPAETHGAFPAYLISPIAFNSLVNPCAEG